MLLRDKMRRFAPDCRGATAIEYGLIAAIVGVGIILSLHNFSDGLLGLYQRVDTEFSKINGG